MYGGCKFQAVLAAAMRRHGYTPVVLLPAPDRNIETLYTALGPTEFFYDSHLVKATDLARGQQRASTLLGKVGAIEDLIEHQVDGCRVGRNALSLALRRLRVGQLDLKNREHAVVLQEALSVSLARVDCYREFVRQVAPERAVFLERGYSPSAELFDACLEQEVESVQWCSAPLENRLLFKRYSRENRGVHPLTLSPESWQSIQQEPWSSRDEARLLEYHESIYAAGGLYNRQKLQDGKAIVDRAALIENLQLDPNKKIAVIFCHILYDATFFYGENLFSDYLSWLLETVRVAMDNPRLNWIVKVHPVNLWRSRADGKEMEQLEVAALRQAFGELPSHIRIMPADTPINTYSLFNAIDYGLTVRGTVGMELPCYGIPVVTAGSGRYSGRGFTIDPPTPNEYRSILLELHEQPRLSRQMIIAAQSYTMAVLYRRCWPMRGLCINYEKTNAPIPAMSVDVQLTAPSPEQVLDDDHLGEVARWIDGHDEDYLIPVTEPANAPDL